MIYYTFEAVEKILHGQNDFDITRKDVEKATDEVFQEHCVTIAPVEVKVKNAYFLVQINKFAHGMFQTIIEKSPNPDDIGMWDMRDNKAEFKKEFVFTKQFYGQGHIFKSQRNFNLGRKYGKELPVYVPELDSKSEWEEEKEYPKPCAYYTYQDFLNICDGDAEKAQELFEDVDWQHPETLHMEYEEHREMGE